MTLTGPKPVSKTHVEGKGWTTPGDAQDLLWLCTQKFLLGVLRGPYRAPQIKLSLMQGKHTTCLTIYLAPSPFFFKQTTLNILVW